jgi:hypothetical protein
MNFQFYHFPLSHTFNLFQIYHEKQEAKRLYEEQMEREKQKEAEDKLSQQALLDQLQKAVSHSPPSVQESSKSSKRTIGHSQPSAQEGSKSIFADKDKQKHDEKEQLAVPVPEVRDKVSDKGLEQVQPLSKSPRNKQGLTFTETMEKLNRQRMQDLMDIEAKELVGFLKVLIHPLPPLHPHPPLILFYFLVQEIE